MFEVPDFTLTERSGKLFAASAEMRGKIWVADFFFASCPGVCLELSKRMSFLHHETRDLPGVRFLSISTDEKDTPEVLRPYAQQHGAGDRWSFVTGPKAEVFKLSVDGFKLALADAAGVDVAEKFIHSTKLVLIDGKGWIRGYYDGIGENQAGEAKRLLADIRRLLSGAMTAADLPPINASLNALATVLLISGIVAIKREAKKAHGLLMGATFAVSSVFLVCYVAHKILMRGVHTPFGGDGVWRAIYYPMLISHIILAICVPPLAIITMRHALHARYDAHRRWAKITFPIWLYVSVTGVLVYFFLHRWFPRG